MAERRTYVAGAVGGQFAVLGAMLVDLELGVDDGPAELALWSVLLGGAALSLYCWSEVLSSRE